MEISPRGPGRMGPSGRAGAAGLAWTRLPEPARAAPAVGPVRVVGTATGPGGHSGRLRASVPEPCPGPDPGPVAHQMPVALGK